MNLASTSLSDSVPAKLMPSISSPVKDEPARAFKEVWPERGHQFAGAWERGRVKWLANAAYSIRCVPESPNFLVVFSVC